MQGRVKPLQITLGPSSGLQVWPSIKAKPWSFQYLDPNTYDLWLCFPRCLGDISSTVVVVSGYNLACSPYPGCQSPPGLLHFSVGKTFNLTSRAKAPMAKVISRMFPKETANNLQKFQVPKMEVLHLIMLFWGVGFPLHKPYIQLYRWVPPFRVPEMFGETSNHVLPHRLWETNMKPTDLIW